MTTRRRILRQATALGLVAPVAEALSQPGSACSPAPQCRKACGPTSSATEGPFYVRNAPMLVDINVGKSPGTPMRIGGTVFSEDGTTPLKGAQVEIWHADGQGDYHPNGNGDIGGYRRGQINLRGSTRTDEQGRFAFTSIVPGRYGGRRRHIHWRITAPGHRDLTTQSYWIEERGTEIDRRDFTDRNPEACRWVKFNTEGGTAVGLFDVVMKKSA